jgi:hypothetical protein
VLAHHAEDLPWVVREDRAPRRCWTGALSDVITSSGTPPVTRWIPLAGGKAREVPDLIGMFGAKLLRRTAAGALVAEAADGTVAELVPAGCGGRVLSTGDDGRTLVVACKTGELFEYGRGKPRAIGATIDVPDEDSLATGRFLFVSGKDGGSIMIDTHTGALRETGEYQNQLAVRGAITVLQRRDKLVILDGTTEHELGAIERYPKILWGGRYLYVEPLVVDLATGALVGRAPTRQLTAGGLTFSVRANVKALATDGRLLVGFGGGRWDLTPGPLEWVRPAP